MVKIIIIRNAYAYDFGGGERFPVFLAEQLQASELSPIVVSRNPTLLEFAESRDIPTIRGWWWSNQNWSGWRVLFFPLYALWQLVLYVWYLQMFRRQRPSAVHIQSKDDFIAATYAAKAVGAKVVWTDHADLKHVWQNLQTPYKNPIGKWIYQAVRLVDVITVVSQSEKKEVLARLPADSPLLKKIAVIYNGCSDQLAKYPRTADDQLTTFVVANRLVTDKGIGETIEAFRKLHDEHADTQLVLVGDGPEKSQFIEQAQETEGIIFMGYQPDPYVAIRAADIFLQPTYHEGFSVVLVEASMLEMPIIATSVGGNTEIIRNGETGLLVPARDFEALYGAMKRLYGDQKLRTTLAQNARSTYLDRYVFETIVKDRFIPLYEKETHEN